MAKQITIDWSTIQPSLNYFAIDGDGKSFFYEEKPSWDHRTQKWTTNKWYHEHIQFIVSNANPVLLPITGPESLLTRPSSVVAMGDKTFPRFTYDEVHAMRNKLIREDYSPDDDEATLCEMLKDLANRVQGSRRTVIVWEYVHPDFKWYARNSLQEGIFFQERPETYQDDKGWIWKTKTLSISRSARLLSNSVIREGNEPWQESLIERPERV